MDKIISHGESVFRSYVERKWAKPENLIDVEYIKTLGGFLPILNCNLNSLSSFTTMYVILT